MRRREAFCFSSVRLSHDGLGASVSSHDHRSASESSICGMKLQRMTDNTYFIAEQASDPAVGGAGCRTSNNCLLSNKRLSWFRSIVGLGIFKLKGSGCTFVNPKHPKLGASNPFVPPLLQDHGRPEIQEHSGSIAFRLLDLVQLCVQTCGP